MGVASDAKPPPDKTVAKKSQDFPARNKPFSVYFFAAQSSSLYVCAGLSSLASIVILAMSLIVNKNSAIIVMCSLTNEILLS
jgi:hypothetical protein